MLTLFVKLLLLAGIPLGIFSGVYFARSSGLMQGVIRGFMGGIILGSLVSSLLISLHIYLFKKMAGDATVSDYSIHQVKKVVLFLAYDETYDACLKSIGTINRCRVITNNRSSGRVIAKAGLNWKTWGDDITFHITRADHNATQVTVSSRPSARSTLVDFGRNLENVQKLTGFLKRYPLFGQEAAS